MHTLHLVPGEKPGDDAEIVLSSQALPSLVTLLGRLHHEGDDHGVAAFNQRDGKPYRVLVQIIDHEHTHSDWPRTSTQPGTRGHSQRDTAFALGLSVATILSSANFKSVPKPESWEKLFAYTNTTLEEYELG